MSGNGADKAAIADWFKTRDLSLSIADAGGRFREVGVDVLAYAATDTAMEMEARRYHVVQPSGNRAQRRAALAKQRRRP